MQKNCIFFTLLYSKKNKFWIQNIWPMNYTYEISQCFNIYFSCQAAVIKGNVYLSCTKFSSIYFSCLSALKKPAVYLPWAKFSPSLLDIKIYHNQWKLISANQWRSFILLFLVLGLSDGIMSEQWYLFIAYCFERDECLLTCAIFIILILVL